MCGKRSGLRTMGLVRVVVDFQKFEVYQRVTVGTSLSDSVCAATPDFERSSQLRKEP
jgi:hypothetical protein